MRPQKSTSYDMLSDARKSPELPVLTPGGKNGRLFDSRMVLAPAPAEMVGKSAARLNWIAASAWR
jgi:hypothetical protein